MKTVFNKETMPKIGIRPTIDGRLGGVRESLEDQTMNQAKATAAFISENLCYPDGSAVECVIADSCIGGVAEAAACADKFRKDNVGVSLMGNFELGPPSDKQRTTLKALVRWLVREYRIPSSGLATHQAVKKQGLNARLRAIRALGLGIVDRSPGLKRFFVSEAAGGTGDVPRLMKGEAL